MAQKWFKSNLSKFMITIDAKNKILGRLASEIAVILLGKNKPDYVPYKITGEQVEVININKLITSGNKWANKIYYTHTGYPGHLRERKMREFSQAELLKKAVWNMLPKNKWRSERIEMLIIRSK